METSLGKNQNISPVLNMQQNMADEHRRLACSTPTKGAINYFVTYFTKILKKLDRQQIKEYYPESVINICKKASN